MDLNPNSNTYKQFITSKTLSSNINIHDWAFNAVDGIQLTRSNYQSTLQNSVNSFTLNMVNFDGVTVTPNGKSVNLTKQNYIHEAIFLEKTFTIGTANIGYLMYNNDFSKNYITNLNTTFLNFKNPVEDSVTILTLILSTKGSFFPAEFFRVSKSQTFVAFHWLGDVQFNNFSIPLSYFDSPRKPGAVKS